MSEWETANQWEAQWWGNATNTWDEERKQIEYAKRMGLYRFWHEGHDPTYEFYNRRVLDVGGGPCSILLKGIHIAFGVIVDPLPIPDWAKARYASMGLVFQQVKGEQIDYPADSFDVGLIYNVLQHTEDPERIAWNMRRCCNLIRVFEWVETGLSDGHIHNLHAKDLERWFGGPGTVDVCESTMCWSGVFAGGFNA